MSTRPRHVRNRIAQGWIRRQRHQKRKQSGLLVRLSKPEWTALTQLADQKGVTPASWVRKTIDNAALNALPGGRVLSALFAEVKPDNEAPWSKLIEEGEVLAA